MQQHSKLLAVVVGLVPSTRLHLERRDLPERVTPARSTLSTTAVPVGLAGITTPALAVAAAVRVAIMYPLLALEGLAVLAALPLEQPGQPGILTAGRVLPVEARDKLVTLPLLTAAAVVVLVTAGR
jgi:hypothetical protein